MVHNLPYFSDFIFYYFLEALFTTLYPQWPCFPWTTPRMVHPQGLCTCYFLCLEYFSPRIPMATPIITSETGFNNT